MNERPDIWLQGVAIILPQVQLELNPVRVEFATLSLYVGLILGASAYILSALYSPALQSLQYLRRRTAEHHKPFDVYPSSISLTVHLCVVRNLN